MHLKFLYICVDMISLAKNSIYNTNYVTQAAASEIYSLLFALPTVNITLMLHLGVQTLETIIILSLNVTRCHI